LPAVEGEQPRVERLEAEAAAGAEEALGVEALGAVRERDRRAAAEAKRPFEGLLQAGQVRGQSGDDEVDVVLAVAVEERDAGERDATTVDACLAQAELPRRASSSLW